MGRLARRTITGLALATAAAGPIAAEPPVVVELYTSQGCSSCPPADALLTELAKKHDVLALALHVDYWDYLGWTDDFADPAHAERQRGYARAAGSRTIYTPQIVVEGVDHVVGNRPMQVMELIQKHEARSDPVAVTLSREDGRLTIEAEATGKVPDGMEVQLVLFTPHRAVEVERGENAGLTIDYVNIVDEWTGLGRWDGREPLVLEREVSGPAAVIVQAPNHGAVLGAARID